MKQWLTSLQLSSFETPQLLGAGTTVYVGSVAALAIGVSAAVFIALFLITRTRRRG